MRDESKERCLELCERASKEQDPKKMLALMSEVNRLLEQKEAHLDSFCEFAPPTAS